MRDHRQRQKGELQEGLFQRGAQGEGGLAQMVQGVSHALVRFEAHQAGDGQGDLAGDLAVMDDDEAAFDLAETIDGKCHVVVIDADDADIMAVMPDGGRDRTLLQAEALDEAIGMIAVDAVALDHGNLDDVPV